MMNFLPNTADYMNSLLYRRFTKVRRRSYNTPSASRHITKGDNQHRYTWPDLAWPDTGPTHPDWLPCIPHAITITSNSASSLPPQPNTLQCGITSLSELYFALLSLLHLRGHDWPVYFCLLGAGVFAWGVTEMCTLLPSEGLSQADTEQGVTSSLLDTLTETRK